MHANILRRLINDILTAASQANPKLCNWTRLNDWHRMAPSSRVSRPNRGNTLYITRIPVASRACRATFPELPHEFLYGSVRSLVRMVVVFVLLTQLLVVPTSLAIRLAAQGHTYCLSCWSRGHLISPVRHFTSSRFSVHARSALCEYAYKLNSCIFANG